MTRRAFTLVELIVVIAILAALMGMTVLSTRGDQREAPVRAAAEELAATLRATRQRAMATHQAHGVAFNIQNAVGSSGEVLNNRGGGHWYRVIGPARRTRFVQEMRNLVPWAGGKVMRNRDNNSWSPGNFPDFIADVADAWRGDPHVLTPGRVRFLALGDTDEGPRRRPGSLAVLYGDGGERTYPRPWFGYFDPVAKRLWPWGGYDPGKPSSGFAYAGSDGTITGCVNPADRRVDQDWDAIDFSGGVPSSGGTVVIADTDRNGDGDVDDPYERERGWPIWRKDEPRPLVNAAWLDACLVFLPDGTCFFGEWNRARRYFDADPITNFNSSSFFKGHLGIPDRAVASTNIYARGFTDRTNPDPNQIGEVAHFDRHTGGWHITLAPDSPDDRQSFATAKEAAESFLPAWRVFVSRYGVVRAFRVQRRDGWLAGLPTAGPGSPWPKDPDDWLATDTYNSPVVRRCRLGWLHRDNVLEPTGSPITDLLDPAMLERRVWWRE